MMRATVFIGLLACASVATLVAVAANNVITPNNAALTSSAGRRP